VCILGILIQSISNLSQYDPVGSCIKHQIQLQQSPTNTMDLTKGVVVRRWNSVPLDPTPQPPPYLVVTETPAEDANNNYAIEKVDNATEFEEEEGGDKPDVQISSTPDTASSEEVTSPQGGTDDDPSKRGRGWGRGIVQDYKSTVGVSRKNVNCMKVNSIC